MCLSHAVTPVKISMEWDPAEVYTCNDFAEEDMQNIEHIYLMYNVKQDRDALEIRCAAGVAVRN